MCIRDRAQGIAPLFGYCYGAQQTKRLRKTVFIGAFFDILLGIFFMVVFALFAHILTAFFLDDSSLITQSASFLKVIGLSAPMIGIINIVTSYFQALGKALNSMITVSYTHLTKCIKYCLPSILCRKSYTDSTKNSYICID